MELKNEKGDQIKFIQKRKKNPTASDSAEHLHERKKRASFQKIHTV